MKELRIEYSSFGIRREVTCPVPEKWGRTDTGTVPACVAAVSSGNG